MIHRLLKSFPIRSVFEPVLPLISPIASRTQQLGRTVLRFFLHQIPTADADPSHTIFPSVTSLDMLNGFAQFVLGLPENDAQIRDLIFNESIVTDAIDYLPRSLILEHPEPLSLEEPCLPALLKILATMVRGH
jgi:hypothetical protein